MHVKIARWWPVAVLVLGQVTGCGSVLGKNARELPVEPPSQEPETPTLQASGAPEAPAAEAIAADVSMPSGAMDDMSPGNAAGGPAPARHARAMAPPPPPQPAAPSIGAGVARPVAAPQRKVHYDGYLQIIATKPQELLGRAEALSKAAGGYVESLSGNRLVVRVPVAGFRPLFEQLLELGEVLQQRITARDITDAYQAVALRLRVLRASRERLMQLLAKVFREHEKLALLAQIKRLTEQVDQLQLQLQTLGRMVDYSRITIEASPRPQPAAGLAHRDLGAFEWIGALSPFHRTVAERCDRFEIPVPKGMVELDHDDSFWGGDPWVAQSADGVKVWTMQRSNNPRASAKFWHEALRERLSRRYPAHESYQIGAFQVLELHEQLGQHKYRYLVAVKVDDDDLQVVEIYYPSQEHLQRHSAAIKRALERS